MVRVEDGDQLAIRMQHAIVEVAGLGVFVALAREVAHTEIVAQRLQFGIASGRALRFDEVCRVALLQRAAVVEQPDRQLVGGIVHRLGCRERVGQQPCVFVVGGHEDIDLRELAGRDGTRLARRQRHRHHEQAQRQHHHAVHFGEVEQEAGNEVFGLVKRRQGARRAPIDVTQHHGRTEGKSDQPPAAAGIGELEHGHERDDENADDKLGL